MGHVFFVLVLSVLASKAAERWEVLPPTPAPIKSERSGQASASGISIYYAVYGQGPPVILLHGGLANADYWGNQIKALAPYHTVIVMDSRGRRPRRSDQARAYGVHRINNPACRTADPAQRKPFRFPAGPGTFQLLDSTFPRRRVSAEIIGRTFLVRGGSPTLACYIGIRETQ